MSHGLADAGEERLLGVVMGAALEKTMFAVRREDFGADFVFGVATAAYQIEGGQTDGRKSSIWDTFAATPGNTKNGESGSVACDHYARWRGDLDLIKDGGFSAYRFSFAWPRLIPDGTGAVNAKGIAFYDRLIDGMLERNLRDALSLGFALGAAGPRRLDESRYRELVRRLCRGRCSPLW
jgi:hypothetical protein